jgi:hypothetical protein
MANHLRLFEKYSQLSLQDYKERVLAPVGGRGREVLGVGLVEVYRMVGLGKDLYVNRTLFMEKCDTLLSLIGRTRN